MRGRKTSKENNSPEINDDRWEENKKMSLKKTKRGNTIKRRKKIRRVTHKDKQRPQNQVKERKENVNNDPQIKKN